MLGVAPFIGNETPIGYMVQNKAQSHYHEYITACTGRFWNEIIPTIMAIVHTGNIATKKVRMEWLTIVLGVQPKVAAP